MPPRVPILRENLALRFVPSVDVVSRTTVVKRETVTNPRRTDAKASNTLGPNRHDRRYGSGWMDAREERLAKNEVVFRDVNERIAGMAAEHAQALRDRRDVGFICECSNVGERNSYGNDPASRPG